MVGGGGSWVVHHGQEDEVNKVAPVLWRVSRHTSIGICAGPDLEAARTPCYFPAIPNFPLGACPPHRKDSIPSQGCTSRQYPRLSSIYVSTDLLISPHCAVTTSNHPSSAHSTPPQDPSNFTTGMRLHPNPSALSDPIHHFNPHTIAFSCSQSNTDPSITSSQAPTPLDLRDSRQRPDCLLYV